MKSLYEDQNITQDLKKFTFFIDKSHVRLKIMSLNFIDDYYLRLKKKIHKYIYELFNNKSSYNNRVKYEFDFYQLDFFFS